MLFLTGDVMNVLHAGMDNFLDCMCGKREV